MDFRKQAEHLVLPVLFLALAAGSFVLQKQSRLTNVLIACSAPLSGRMMDDYYADRGVWVMRKNGEKYIVGIAPETSAEYETEQLSQFYDYVTKRGIDFLYVNAPSKCLLDDSEITEYFGLPSYSNANADRLFHNLDEIGIPYLDLRKCMQAEGKELLPMYYRTDHHWRAETGFWAAGLVTAELNRLYGYGLDENALSPAAFTFETVDRAWIGEQGCLFSPQFIGYDSFTHITPKKEGHYICENAAHEVKEEGGFSIFLDPLPEKLPVTNSLHYSYCPHGIDEQRYINCDRPDGKRILLLCDSYSNVFVPFFMQTVQQIDTLLLRQTDIRPTELIEQNDYDAVVMLYAQFMIGARDDHASANYEMFHLMP